MEQVLELKHIHYAYHNLEGETPCLLYTSCSHTGKTAGYRSFSPAS